MASGRVDHDARAEQLWRVLRGLAGEDGRVTARNAEIGYALGWSGRFVWDYAHRLASQGRLRIEREPGRKWAVYVLTREGS